MISLSPGSFGLQLACSLTSSEVGAGFVRVKEKWIPGPGWLLLAGPGGFVWGPGQPLLAGPRAGSASGQWEFSEAPGNQHWLISLLEWKHFAAS